MCVQDDGQKVWTFDPEWKDFWVDVNIQEAIAWAIDHDPNAMIMSYEGFTIRQRSA